MPKEILGHRKLLACSGGLPNPSRDYEHPFAGYQCAPGSTYLRCLTLVNDQSLFHSEWTMIIVIIGIISGTNIHATISQESYERLQILSRIIVLERI